MKLSLIIPVYNVELYVERCLLSCAKQNIPQDDYEIIVINDGSTDQSLDIVNKLKSSIPNMVVVNQKNSGLSAVRNKGVAMAKGDFVWFIDSDDWIEENCLLGILSKIEGYDLMAMGYIDVFNNKQIIVDYHNKNDFKTGYDLQSLLYNSFNKPAQLYIIRKSLLLDNNLSFCEGIYHEDVDFTPRLLHYAKKIVILEHPVYYFYQRPNSITTSINPKRAYDLIDIINPRLLCFLSTLSDVKEKMVFTNIISENINKALDMALKFPIKDKQRIGDMRSRRDSLNIMKRSSITKYSLEGYLFYYFPKYSLCLYKFLQILNLRKYKKKLTSR